MADIYDQEGNPIQLTDELGRPVQLTDERGRPIHLTGVAGVDSAPHDSTTIGSDPMLHNGKTHLNHTIPDAMPGGAGGVEHAVQRPESSRTTIGSEFKMHDHGTQLNPTIPGGAGLGTAAMIGGAGGETAVIGGAGSCSSSEEDDGEGGRRRKKKGLMQKIKEKLPGQKNKEEKAPEMVYTATTKISVTTPAGQLPGEPKTEYIRVEHHEEEHAKKGLMDKIKDKLPGHHSH